MRTASWETVPATPLLPPATFRKRVYEVRSCRRATTAATIVSGKMLGCSPAQGRTVSPSGCPLSAIETNPMTGWPVVTDAEFF